MDHKNTHLSEEELALYAEALNQGDLSNVSSSIRQHIAECDECAMETINISDILSEEKEEKTKHTRQKNQDKRKSFLILIASITVVIIVIILILYN